MSAYEIKNLKFKNILNIKELYIPSNKITIISGKSGVGKSTLFSLLTCKTYDYDGDILLNNKSIKNTPVKDIFKKIVFLDQNYILLGQTIQEEFQIICNILNLEYNEEKIKKFLNIVDLQYDFAKTSEKFSGGEKQRLTIARTLYTQRDITLLDEPTSALDTETTKNVINNLYEYSQNEKKTIIMISHNNSIIEDEKFNQINLGDYNE